MTKWYIKVESGICYTNKKLDKDMVTYLKSIGVEINFDPLFTT